MVRARRYLEKINRINVIPKYILNDELCYPCLNKLCGYCFSDI